MADAYIDRCMLKWLPFQSLPEQSDEISALLKGKTLVEKPILSEDQYAEMQYRFEEAFETKASVEVVYFSNGKRQRLYGIILGVDAVHQMMMFTTGTLPIESILSIH